MERITYNEAHQRSASELTDFVNNLENEGYSLKEQSLAAISACLIEMNGYLAAIAESLRNKEDS